MMATEISSERQRVIPNDGSKNAVCGWIGGNHLDH